MGTQVAPPEKVVEAWHNGVMYGGSLTYVQHEVAMHPIPADVPDPIYHRDEGGWRRASGILSESAMSRLETYLAQRGYRLPDSTLAAWEQTRLCNAREVKIRTTVESTLQTWRGADVPTLVEMIGVALATLEE